jgi:putative peptidoglycan lipid II flippase
MALIGRMESFRRGAAYSSALNAAAQGLAFLTSLVFAYLFGTQGKTDVYYYCLGVLMILAGFTTHVSSAVLIPEAMHRAAREGAGAGMDFINFFLYVFLALGLALVLVMWLQPIRIFLSLSRFDPDLLKTHRLLVAGCIPLLLFTILSQYLSDVLTAYRLFTLPMLMNVLNRLVVLAALVGLHRRLDILSLVVGGWLGGALQVGLMLWLLRRTLGWRFRPRRIRLTGVVGRNMIYAQSGCVASTLSAYLPLFLLSGFAAGILTALSYGQRLAMIPALMLTTQISSVVAIRLNEACARGDWAGADRAFGRSIRYLLLATVPLSGFCFLYAREITEALYLRGAFDAEAAGRTALFFRVFVLNLPLLAANTIVARLFMATQKIRQAFGYQIAINLVQIALLLAGIRLWGAVGYPIAVAATGLLNLLLLWPLMKWMFPFVRYAEVLRYGARWGALTAGVVVLAGLIRAAGSPDSTWLALAAGALGYGVLWLAASFVFRPDREIHEELVQGFYRRMFRQAG